MARTGARTTRTLGLGGQEFSERVIVHKGAREIVVVGGGNSAVEEGFHLTNFAEKVTLLERGGFDLDQRVLEEDGLIVIARCGITKRSSVIKCLLVRGNCFVAL